PARQQGAHPLRQGPRVGTQLARLLLARARLPFLAADLRARGSRHLRSPAGAGALPKARGSPALLCSRLGRSRGRLLAPGRRGKGARDLEAGTGPLPRRCGAQGAAVPDRSRRARHLSPGALRHHRAGRDQPERGLRRPPGSGTREVTPIRRLAPTVALAIAGGVAVAGQSGAPSAAPAAGVPKAAIRFDEIAARAGVRFVQTPRRFGKRHKAQVLEMFTDGGAAVAVGDYDHDGDDDLFLVDSDEGKQHHLMRCDGVKDGVPIFTDVTASAGVGGGNDARSIVSDALWFDYDNDGFLDLYLGRFGTPILLRNLGPDAKGQWRFEDVSERAGLTLFGNTIGTIAFDADNDGYLDLMLANYFQPLNLLELKTTKVLPNNLDYATNGGGVTFFRNVALPGGGRGFVDETKSAGLAHHTGWSLDIGHADLDNDGDQDVYVAGDYGTDRLFLNQGRDASGRVTFRDATVGARGGLDTRKVSNVDMGDYDRDGWLDIYVTNITDEYMKECNFLWHNNGVGPDGKLTFTNLSKETGTCDGGWGWAAKFGDFDNDGWEDIFTVNG